MEFVKPTTWRRLAVHEEFIRKTYTASIKRFRRGNDHVEPILRWFIMHMRDNDANAVNRFADAAFTDSLSGRHARLHAIMIFGRWNGFDYPKEFLGWEELMNDNLARKYWGRSYGLGKAGQSPDDL